MGGSAPLSTEALTRDRLVGNARLHHLLHALSTARYPDYRHLWSGDGARGLYVHENGSGDALVLRWDPDRVLALAFDHESERAEDESTPPTRLPWIQPLDEEHGPALRAALEEATAHAYLGVPTAAGVAGSEGARFTEPVERAVDNGMWQLERYALEPPEAVFGRKGQNWKTLSSLPKPLASLALALCTEPGARLSSRGLRALAAFAQPRFLMRPRVEATLSLLERAGVERPEVDWAALEPERVVVVVPDVKRVSRGSALVDPGLEGLGIHVRVLEPTRFPRDAWSRVLALSVRTDAVEGWEPGDFDHPQPEVALVDAEGRALPFERHVTDDRASQGFHRVLTLECVAPIPLEARLRLTFLRASSPR